MKITKTDVRRKPKKTTHVYFFHDETILENLQNRRSRPVDEYQKLMPEVLTAAGIPPETKATWSQRAGCKCGCSPGFLLKTAPDVTADIYVDVCQ